MHRILIVYFSRTGYTQRLATAVASGLLADVERLEDVRDRSGIWGYLRSAREAMRKRIVDIRRISHDPARYDAVVIGTPVWASNVSSPVRSYVAAHKLDLKKVAFFCTLGGSGAPKVFRELAELCGKAPVATLAVSDRELDRAKFDRELERFVRAVAQSVAAASASEQGNRSAA